MDKCRPYFTILLLIILQIELSAQINTSRLQQNPGAYFFNIDLDQTQRRLKQIVGQRDNADPVSDTIRLPDHKGIYQLFRITEDPVALPEIYNKYPQNKTYRIVSVNDPHTYGAVSMSPRGVEAVIIDQEKAVFIEPQVGNLHLAQVHSSAELKEFSCQVLGSEETERLSGTTTHKRGNDSNIRTYRLAVTAAAEFSNARNNNFGTINADLNHYITVMNAFYEYELGIRFVRVSGDDLIFTNPSTDGITPGDPISVHTVIASKLSTSSFDIGHGFGQITSGGSGIAYLSVVCNNSTKGRGWSSASSNGLMIGIVLHEVGHQFGASHSFYGLSANCANRSAGYGYEPGSGSSLMSYEGLCWAYGTDCSVSHNITPEVGTYYFHNASLVQIVNKINATSCPSVSNNGNDVPSMNMPVNKSIPYGTPFELEGSATDSDPLTYNWEEYDTDGNTVNCTTAHPDNAANSPTAPLFRSFDPSPTGYKRQFPKPSDLINNVHTMGEILPQVARTIKMRLTARDGKGGTNWGETQLTVVGGAGPFTVNTANSATTYSGGQSVTVTWNVANTTASPISCSQVDILWSNDGGNQFSTILAAGTPNDGSQSVIIPNVGTTQGRIKIKAVGNYFFDVNNAMITVSSGCTPKTTYLMDATEITADAGTPELNLNLPFGEKITSTSGSTSSGPVSQNPINQSYGSNNCTPYSSARYQTLQLQVSQTGIYNLSPSALFCLSLFNGGFNASNVCSNFMASNLFDAGGGYYGYAGDGSLSANMVQGQAYSLRIGFSGNYTLNFSGAGDIFINGTTSANFLYKYVMIKDGQIKAISNTADMSDPSSFPAGTYTVYGLYVSNSANLNGYVNQSFSSLQSALNGGSICGLLSANQKLVNISGCMPATVQVTSTSSNVNTPGSLPYVLANACTGDTIRFTLPGNSTIVLNAQQTISDFCFLDGTLAPGLTISGGNSVRLFEISETGALVLKNIKLALGNAPSNGGAFWNKGQVDLDNVVFQGNLQNGQAKAFTNQGIIHMHGPVNVVN